MADVMRSSYEQPAHGAFTSGGRPLGRPERHTNRQSMVGCRIGNSSRL